MLGSSCAYATLGAMRTPASAAIVLSLRAHAGGGVIVLSLRGRGVRAKASILMRAAARDLLCDG